MRVGVRCLCLRFLSSSVAASEAIPRCTGRRDWRSVSPLPQGASTARSSALTLVRPLRRRSPHLDNQTPLEPEEPRDREALHFQTARPSFLVGASHPTSPPAQHLFSRSW